MSSDSPSIDVGRATNGHQKPNGKVRLLTLDDLDGRTKAAQYVRETRRDIVADLGGEDGLSTLEQVAVDNVAVLDAMLKDAATRWLQGHELEVSVIATLTNSFNRTAAVLGWQRRAKDVTPDLQSYLAHKAAAKAEEGGV